jgi:hypothetical protein
MNFEQVSKKKKTELNVDNSIRSDEVINLIFVDSNETKAYQRFKPQFTHQLFENEKISYFRNPASANVSIYIDCRYLTHAVTFSCGFDELEIKATKKHLKLALPVDTKFFVNSSDFKAFEKSSLSIDGPFGTLVESFIVENQFFEIFIATSKDAGATEFLCKAEKVAIWFIETADSVDFTDERWEALFLFRQKIKNISNNSKTSEELITKKTEKSDEEQPTRTFAGYFTLFTFNNPFLGSKIRVCQALILPHLQDFGLGKKMLHTICKLANERSHIVEVTVEDPAPVFQALRDAVDFECFLNLLLTLNTKNNQLQFTKQSLLSSSIYSFFLDEENSNNNNNNNNNINSNNNNNKSIRKSENEETLILKISEILKITNQQSYFVVNSFFFIQMMAQIKNEFLNDEKNIVKISNAGIETKTENFENNFENNLSFKNFRLSIKRKILNQSCNKELKSLPKQELQNELQVLFDSDLKRFQKMEKKFRKYFEEE